MEDEEKQKYKDMNAKDKERYAKEMETYVPTPGFEPEPKKKKTKSKSKKKKKKKKHIIAGAPKKASSAFIFFSSELRKSLKNVKSEDGTPYSFSEIAKRISKEWGALDEGGKAKFVALAEEDKARYEREYAAFLEEHPEGIEESESDEVSDVSESDDDDDEDDEEEED